MLVCTVHGVYHIKNSMKMMTPGERITKKQLFDAIADGLSLPRVTKQIPVGVARFACEMISSFAPFLPVEKQRGLAWFSRAAFRLAGVNQGFSVKKRRKRFELRQSCTF